MKETIRLFGKLTDFNGNPISRGDVCIKDSNFKDIYCAKTDQYGNYVLDVEKGTYMALYGGKNFGINTLEHWTWNLPAYKDTEINIKANEIEVYGVNSFVLQKEKPMLMAYFRPRSLSKTIKHKEILKDTKNIQSKDIIDLCPSLKDDEICLSLNNRNLNVLEVNKIKERDSHTGKYMEAYLVQAELPENLMKDNFNKVRVTLKDIETNEMGEGSFYLEQSKCV